MTSVFDFFLYWPVLVTFAFFAISLPHWHKMHISQKIMLFFMADIMPFLVLYIYQALDISGSTITLLKNITFFTTPLAVLLMCLMLHTLVSKDNIPVWFYVIMPIPIILGCNAYYIHYLADAAAANYLQHVSTSVILYNVVLYAGTLAAFIYSFYKLRKSRLILDYYTSDGEDTVYRPTFLRVVHIAGCIVIFGISNFVSMMPISQRHYLFLIFYTIAFTSYLIYFYNLILSDYHRPAFDEFSRHKDIVPAMKPEAGVSQAAHPVEAALQADVSNSHDRLIKQRLEETIVEQKLYLNHNITLMDIARATHLESEHIARYLSEVSRQTFSEYIHSLRIQYEVMPRLQKNPNTPVTSLMSNSGFRNPAAFYNAFLRYTGTSFPTYQSKLTAGVKNGK
ncbi:MAG: helix-turn-helix domain-containing protein [Paludibacteraceae bacterium]|nr:helix-turn-helix domain-containing protein [Paludibacteraceae bacterium]